MTNPETSNGVASLQNREPIPYNALIATQSMEVSYTYPLLVV